MHQLINILEYFKEANLNEAYRTHALVGVILDGRSKGPKAKKAVVKQVHVSKAEPEPEEVLQPPARKRRRRRTRAEIEAARAEESQVMVPESTNEHGEAQPGLEEFGDPEQPPF